MSLSGKVVVVFGATGVVGSGAANAFLNEGATVVAVGRDLKKLQALKGKVEKNAANLHPVVGDYSSEEVTKKLHQAINTALAGKEIDHIVSSVGFIYAAPGAVTQSALTDLHKALDEGLPQLFLIAREFLPALKNREGSTFTLVSGGFAYVCPEPGYWAGTLKNAALNALTLGIAAETKGDKVRVNNLCIGFGVAPLDGDKNQYGWPSINTREIGKLFVSLVKGNKKGEIVNVQKNEQVAELEKSLAAH